MARKSLVFSLAFVLASFSAAFAKDGWWGEIFEEKQVPLSKVIETPGAFRDLDVTFVIQFQQVGTVENPFYTKFEKEAYLNFSCWPDESPLWEKEVYSKDFPYMFIDRGMKDAKLIATASTYDRFIVVGRVDGVFRGRPWIEVRGIKPIEKKITEPSLARMVKAFTLKKARRYDAAAAEFHLSRVKELPDVIRLMTLREEGMCLAAADRPEDAVAVFSAALQMAPKDAELVKLHKDANQRAKKNKEAPSETEPPKGELTKKEGAGTQGSEGSQPAKKD